MKTYFKNGDSISGAIGLKSICCSVYANNLKSKWKTLLVLDFYFVIGIHSRNWMINFS